MALLVICGQPSSGKSTVAGKLAASFRSLGHEDVTVVDEPSLGLIRDQAYQDAVNEKHTRGKLKSAVERCLSKNSIVILDSLNNIKGYRYELWCIARSIGTKYCMVHVDSPVDRCRDWNRQRPHGEMYSDTVFHDLARRFERPDPRSRWDSPLFSIHPEVIPTTATSGHGSQAPSSHLPQAQLADPSASAAAAETETAAGAAAGAAASASTSSLATARPGPPQQRSSWVRAEGPGPPPAPPPPAPPPVPPVLRNDSQQGMTHEMIEARVPTLDEALAVGALQLGPPENVDLEAPEGEQQVLDAIVQAMSDRGVGGGGGQGGGGGRPQLKPSFATNSTPMLGTNTLHEIDQAAQGVITAISDACAAAAGGAPGLVHFGAGLHALQLNQAVGLAELRRHKRSFLKLATKIMFARLQDSDSAKRMFIEYLGENLTGAAVAATR